MPLKIKSNAQLAGSSVDSVGTCSAHFKGGPRKQEGSIASGYWKNRYQRVPDGLMASPAQARLPPLGRLASRPDLRQMAVIGDIG